MAKFKVIVSDPETGTSKVVELQEARASPLIGRRIGEVMDGAAEVLAYGTAVVVEEADE